jgi:hypothetical protein
MRRKSASAADTTLHNEMREELEEDIYGIAVQEPRGLALAQQKPRIVGEFNAFSCDT